MTKKLTKKAALKEAVFGNWITSLIGALGSVAILVAPTIQNIVADPKIQQSLNGGASLKTSDWVMAGITLFLGLAAKQSGRTGTGEEPKG